MNPKVQDGGNAFPVTSPHEGDWFPGMSLRDWFAGQALNGLLSNPYAVDWEGEELSPAETQRIFAGLSYMHADAMLKAREAT